MDFKAHERTPEQAERERILFALLQTLPRPEHRREFEQVLAFAPIWKHYTDFAEYYDDFIALIDQGFIAKSSALTYVHNGTWQDRFPPSAYHLTIKGRFIVENKAWWVFDGVTSEDEKSIKR